MGGGLNLPNTIGVSTNQQIQIHRDRRTLEGVEYQHQMWGLQPVPAPSFGCPELKEDTLTTQNNQEYQRTYERLLAWYNYIAYLLAAVRISLVQIDNEMDDVAAALRKGMREKNAGKTIKDTSRITPAEMEDEVQLDPHYQELSVEQQRLTQHKIMLDTRVECLERSLKVISRHVEIRRQEMEGSRIGDNISSRNTPLRRPVT